MYGGHLLHEGGYLIAGAVFILREVKPRDEMLQEVAVSTNFSSLREMAVIYVPAPILIFYVAVESEFNEMYSL